MQNNIPDWLKLAAEGRLQEAYEISSATNNFPEICGRICPQDKLCEGNCVIEKDFGSVTIGAIERYITETAFENGWIKSSAPQAENGLSIGIIGAGPAGLAAADMLRRKGYAVHVYDRYDRVGGLMVYGIPNFKLEKNIVARRHQLLADSGVIFHCGIEVGKNLTLAELKNRHDALLIATGVYKAREVSIPGNDLPGVVAALEYLTASNRVCLGDKVADYENGRLNAKNKHVVVIGGGDTAMDCVRTAIRQQAEKVTCLYRRNRANMPGSAREVKNAEEEGVEFAWLSAPKSLLGNSKLEQIMVQKMRLTAHDKNGRANVVEAEGESFQLKADMVIKALGYDAEDIPTLFSTPELKLSPSGTIAVNSQFETNIPEIFAAGDIVRGASLVVWAISDGRNAAEAIDQKLKNKHKKAA